MLHTALALAEKGLAVFPCAPASKKPACTHGCLEATTDIITINAWWQENPRFNVAIATGTISGIFVIDLDGAEAENALAALGQLPPTIAVITAPRSSHLFPAAARHHHPQFGGQARRRRYTRRWRLRAQSTERAP